MITRGSADSPCIKCGDPFVNQVDGVCFNCITEPLIEAERLAKKLRAEPQGAPQKPEG